MPYPGQWFKKPGHCDIVQPPNTSQQQHMSLHLLHISSVLMGKHCHEHHQSSDRPQPNKASAQPSRPTSTSSSLLAKALSLGREGSASQPTPSPAPSASASENPTPTPTPTPTPSLIQPLAHDAPKPPRPARTPAVTSKALSTTPERDKSKPHRRKYPNSMRQRH